MGRGIMMMQKLPHEELLRRQKEQSQKAKIPLTVVLNDIRSLYNVGSIFRTCDGVGVEKVWLCGITGYPPNQQIAKTALGAEQQVPWEYRQDVLTVIRELKKRKYQIVLLEQTSGSILYDHFKPKPTPGVGLVIGNEVEGVASRILPYCDAAVEIEMAGIKNSLNVSVAFGIAAYHTRSFLKNR